PANTARGVSPGCFVFCARLRTAARHAAIVFTPTVPTSELSPRREKFPFVQSPGRSPVDFPSWFSHAHAARLATTASSHTAAQPKNGRVPGGLGVGGGT